MTRASRAGRSGRSRSRVSCATGSVFDENRSLVFKELHVVRFFDKSRNVLVYVSYSDRLIEGSPKNSISTVPIMGWVPAGDSAVSDTLLHYEPSAVRPAARSR